MRSTGPALVFSTKELMDVERRRRARLVDMLATASTTKMRKTIQRQIAFMDREVLK